MFESRQGIFDAVEIFGIGAKFYLGAGIAPAARVDDFKLGGFFSVGKAHAINLSLSTNRHLQLQRQGVNHRHTHTVQTTGKLVTVTGKFATRVKGGENHLNPRQALFGVNINRHTPAVITHRDGAVFVQNDGDFTGEAGQCLIDTVVDHFLSEVIGPRGVGVHARALAHGVEAG